MFPGGNTPPQNRLSSLFPVWKLTKRRRRDISTTACVSWRTRAPHSQLPGKRRSLRRHATAPAQALSAALPKGVIAVADRSQPRKKPAGRLRGIGAELQMFPGGNTPPQNRLSSLFPVWKLTKRRRRDISTTACVSWRTRAPHTFPCQAPRGRAGTERASTGLVSSFSERGFSCGSFLAERVDVARASI